MQQHKRGPWPTAPPSPARTRVHGIALHAAVPRRQHLHKAAQHLQERALLLRARLFNVRKLVLVSGGVGWGGVGNDGWMGGRAASQRAAGQGGAQAPPAACPARAPSTPSRCLQRCVQPSTLPPACTDTLHPACTAPRRTASAADACSSCEAASAAGSPTASRASTCACSERTAFSVAARSSRASYAWDVGVANGWSVLCHVWV